MSVLDEAADAIRNAQAFVYTAGAGMGVDSGLPDFRGNQGFWNAYPPYATMGFSFSDLANPRWFIEDPALAWGFYGHRLALYRRTVPHEGFQILRRWATARPHFVFTSNVDGQFQRAGFGAEQILECHGAISFNQCTRDCGVGIIAADGSEITVDPVSFRATSRLPICPRCNALLRPNILMFGDDAWDDTRTAEQEVRFHTFLRQIVGLRLVVIECGAGTSIPTVRRLGEQLTAGDSSNRLIRINVRESHGRLTDLGIAMGASVALAALDACIAAAKQ